jgi:hypothetical protein
VCPKGNSSNEEGQVFTEKTEKREKITQMWGSFPTTLQKPLPIKRYSISCFSKGNEEKFLLCVCRRV